MNVFPALVGATMNALFFASIWSSTSHAMRQILKEDHDGILVYVAPTKALVNQIAAEVQARFSKASSQAGGPCIGVRGIKQHDLKDLRNGDEDLASLGTTTSDVPMPDYSTLSYRRKPPGILQLARFCPENQWIEYWKTP
jgi:hypothetical protein